MHMPKTASEAAEAVIKQAKKEKVSVTSYCLAHGVSPAVIYNWQTRNKSYDGGIFQKLMEKH